MQESNVCIMEEKLPISSMMRDDEKCLRLLDHRGITLANGTIALQGSCSYAYIDFLETNLVLSPILLDSAREQDTLFAMDK